MFSSPIVKLTFLSIALSAACSPESPTSPGGWASVAAVPAAGLVGDLGVLLSTASAVTLAWTEVSDGTGAPASYSVRFAASSIDWRIANGCAEIAGTRIGAMVTCTVEGLAADADYAFQVMAYRGSSITPQGSQPSTVITARTASSPPPEQPAVTGIWISPAEVATLPMTGASWINLLVAASRPCGVVDLADQEQATNACIFAKALVFARTRNPTYRDAVVIAIREIVASGTYVGRALALGRELGSYVVAADLIGLKTFDPTLDESFRAKLRTLRTTPTSGSNVATNLIECHEKRPNNWGAHCGATRAAIAVYLEDAADLARTALVFKGYLGDRAAYAGFDYGGPEADLTWQCDPTRPVGINPTDCTRGGAVLDGVLPDDQRRAGGYVWPAPQENYVWEALQGLLPQAVILHRAGYPVWDWQDHALLRATEWLHGVNGFPAVGDDSWLPHIVNRYYRTAFPAPVATTPGKNFGFTEWTHSGTE